MSGNLTRAELLFMIETNKRQRDVAKQRQEWNVVTWHENELRQLNRTLRYTTK